MPMTDYADPETPFPRLEVRLRQVESDAYWLKIWLWEKAGDERHEVFNRKCAGSYRDAHEFIKECSQRYGADVGPDDITVENVVPPQLE